MRGAGVSSLRRVLRSLLWPIKNSEMLILFLIFKVNFKISTDMKNQVWQSN